MKHLIAVLLNTFDGLATAAGIAFGVIVEANPLLVGFSAFEILLIKLLLVNFLILVLHNTDAHRLSRIGTWIIIGIYCHIFVLHILWISACL